MPVNFEQVEEAIAGWIVAATGLPLGPPTGALSGVYNEEAKVGGIAQPYVTYKIGAPRRADGASVHDEIVQTFDATNPNGKQLTFTLTGRREFTVSIDARTKVLTGVGTAQEMMMMVEAVVQRPSQRDVFNAAGLAYLGFESPVNLSERDGPMGMSRVVQDFYFAVVSVDTDSGTWIEKLGSGLPSGTFTGP